MRIRAFIFLAAVASVSTGFAIQACGGSSVADPPADSGVADSGPADTGPADTGPKDTGADTAPPCDPTVDITQGIPDASLNDGSTTTGLCLGCMKTNCAKETKACAEECGCQKIAKDGLDCYLKNTANPIVCAGNFTGAGISSKTQTVGLALIGCIRDECDQECAASAFDPDGGDGG